jgi:hypothetical protein
MKDLRLLGTTFLSSDGKLVRGVVGNDVLALWWSQWLLQGQFTFVFEKILKVEVILFLP